MCSSLSQLQNGSVRLFPRGHKNTDKGMVGLLLVHELKRLKDSMGKQVAHLAPRGFTLEVSMSVAQSQEAEYKIKPIIS